ncbi:MAG: glutamate 5-kinase [Thermoleophilia bacterium]|nr:glutamate 5-kinase [Thermoleophilia bacterium]
MIVVAKLGSSTLVDPGGALRTDTLAERVADLVEVRRRGHRVVLVSSGAIACGLGQLGATDRPTALPDLQAASAVGQGVLFQHYVDAFRPHGVLPAQVLLTSGDLQSRRSYLNARNTLERLLELGTVPIVNENDTVATDELTFGDNDILAAQVAVLLHAGLLALLTDRDGLYGNGGGGPELIEEVPANVEPTDLVLADMGSGTGRGGIRSKLAAAAMASAAGVDCVVASGRTPGLLARAAAGESVGTRIHHRGRRDSAFKLWLRHAKPGLGRIVVDAGAERALRERGTSLLPVGITFCEGPFVAGDAVEVVGEHGRVIGKGIAALSAEEIRRVAGLQSDEVRKRLPGADEEAIHRDRFALADGPAR